MSSENSANMSASSNQADSQAQAPKRNRRTNAQIAADLAEQNRPPRQSGRPIDQRESNTRGNVDMGAIQGLLSDGYEEPSGEGGKAERGPKRPGAETPRQSAPSIWEDDDQQSSDKPDRGALDLDPDEDEDEDMPKKKRAKSLAKFGEELGLDAAKLYDLTVAYDDGESVSLGTLKDHYRETGDLQRSRDEFEDYRTESQNEILVARQQIDGVLQRLTQVVPAEHLARAFSDYEHDARDRARADLQRLREWFPEWDDASAKAKDKEKLTETLKSYGFNAFEVDTIKDARIIRFAVHAMRLMDRYKRLKENFQREKVPSKAPPSAKPGRRPDRNETASRQAKSGDVVGAVATLIG